MPICIVGDSRDLTAVYIGWLARRRQLDVLELSEDRIGDDWYFGYSDTALHGGMISVNGTAYPYTEIQGAYVRLNPHPRSPEGVTLEPQEEATLLVERRHGIQHFLNTAPFPVANRLCAGRSNSSKPYQMRLLTQAGFMVPRWIAANDAAAVEQFMTTCVQGTIVKSCSGLRSHVRRVDDEFLRRLREGASPAIVQEYIPGHDVRVHVVGGRVFPTEVLTSAVDYRFDEGGGEFRSADMPQPLGELCCRFAIAEGLIVAGFDFRVTPDGDWYCLEMNPVPTFLPYEMATGQPIGDAILAAFERPERY